LGIAYTRHDKGQRSKGAQKMTEQLSESEEKILFHTLGYDYMPTWYDKHMMTKYIFLRNANMLKSSKKNGIFN
jgi:hypothetical protein